MPFIKQDYRNEDIQQDIISVRLNPLERRYLEALKMYYNTKSDATALKNKAFEVFKVTENLNKILKGLK